MINGIITIFFVYFFAVLFEFYSKYLRNYFGYNKRKITLKLTKDSGRHTYYRKMKY